MLIIGKSKKTPKNQKNIVEDSRLNRRLTAILSRLLCVCIFLLCVVMLVTYWWQCVCLSYCYVCAYSCCMWLCLSCTDDSVSAFSSPSWFNLHGWLGALYQESVNLLLCVFKLALFYWWWHNPPCYVLLRLHYQSFYDDHMSFFTVWCYASVISHLSENNIIPSYVWLACVVR